MSAPKHGGCADCQRRDVPLLYSVMDPKQAKAPSKAVCADCLQKYPERRR